MTQHGLRVARPGGRLRGRPGPAGRDLVLDATHHEVRAGLTVLVDRVLKPVQPLVDGPEVEVDLGVVPIELQGLQEGRLRLLETPELEADETEVVEEGVGVGALRGQLAVDLLGLLVLVLLEVDEAQEVQHLLVARAQQVRLFELALRLLVALLVIQGLALVEVLEKETLVERRPRRGIAHMAG